MDPLLHLHLHQARVDASVRRHRVHAEQRPRPPGRGREYVAHGLRRVADRLDGARPQPARLVRPA